uniref:Pescadillo homolog n=1 Tax=Araucaria cunninghamii TaxID=56994 RepID=A0A0D6QUE6_ARACU
MPKHYRPAGKKKEGNAAKYITRNKALNRLQLKLPEFRRLCILKGIFPREPKKKLEGNNKTYYHLKDINFLAHEPLLEKSREIKAFEKKIKKAAAKKNKNLVHRLDKGRPSYTLDHIVRQRYPTFIDALRDLDDALTMIHLFAALPAEKIHDIPAERVHSCRRLSLEWQAYISRTHSMRKTFLSVKGIYYQAEVEGQTITWLTPHVLHQVLPDDVDFRVMLTFVEFYETLLGFVNFKLYYDIGVKYPPILDPQLEAAAAELYAMVKGLASNTATSMEEDALDAAVENNAIESEPNELEQKEKILAESQARLALLQHRLSSVGKERDAISDGQQKDMALQIREQSEEGEDDDEETKACRTLFKGFKFFLGREVPRESLLFVIPAFGGVASWEGDGAPYKETDEDITHQIVDRPTQSHKFLSRDYVQPQWVYDCVNARLILPTEDYFVGRVPPPHLSPFVDDEAEGYLPERAETVKRLQAAAKKQLLPMPGMEDQDMNDQVKMLADAIARNEDNEAREKEKREAALERAYQEDLLKELQGDTYSAPLLGKETDELQERSQREESDDSKVLSQIMMSGKKRKLYEAMQMGKAKKKAHVKLLEERKRKTEKKA